MPCHIAQRVPDYHGDACLRGRAEGCPLVFRSVVEGCTWYDLPRAAPPVRRKSLTIRVCSEIRRGGLQSL
eukprot:8911529-Alexandrium_andersonii.AAC.1